MKHNRPVNYLCWLKRLNVGRSAIPRSTYYRLRLHVRPPSTAVTHQLLARNIPNVEETQHVEEDTIHHDNLVAFAKNSSDSEYHPVPEESCEFHNDDGYLDAGHDNIGPSSNNVTKGMDYYI
ncbi:hypothetical protein OUZ56_009563 [Daphnia magna]|uniref:Uncharacterized protein n=1 Tax=Daphnia magna TaxID=35525 RepID=A0ABR0AGF0_9CRUS|nr:hypothetical protein OUZ56_009563 [Daphnia magna]